MACRLFSFMIWATFSALLKKVSYQANPLVNLPKTQQRFVVDKHHLKDIAFGICGTRSRGKGSDVNPSPSLPLLRPQPKGGAVTTWKTSEIFLIWQIGAWMNVERGIREGCEAAAASYNDKKEPCNGSPRRRLRDVMASGSE